MDEINAEEELKKLEGADGKVDQEKLAAMSFKYLLQVDKRLEWGAKKMENLDACQAEVREKVGDLKEDLDEAKDRCPVLAGKKSFQEVHCPPSPKPPREEPAGKDVLRISGLVSTKTLLKVAALIATIAVGGAAYAHFLGGI